MAWTIHYCVPASIMGMSIIKTEQSIDTAGRLVHSIWVVMRSVDEHFILINIENCPYCGLVLN